MDWMEIFTFVTGLIYIYLEVRQKNLMWIVGLITSAASMYVFFGEGFYASTALNLYYFVISFWGLYQWRRDSGRMKGSDALRTDTGNGGKTEEVIHLGRLTLRTVLVSLAVYVVLTAGLIRLVQYLGDPMSMLDAGIAMLGAVATWWLGRSYKEQWILWVAANMLTSVMCLRSGMYYLFVLYLVYTVVAAYGYFHWKRNGKYID